MSERDDRQYHAAAAYVHVGALHVFAVDEIWSGIDAAERNGITLDQIGAALNANWCATVCALAFKNVATLRVLITEARS